MDAEDAEEVKRMGRESRHENIGHASATEEGEDPSERDHPQLEVEERCEQERVNNCAVVCDEGAQDGGDLLRCLQRCGHG